jgi:hypothetical protein
MYRCFPLMLPMTDNDEVVPAVADFSAMATLGPAREAFAELRANRCWEMTDATRTDFQRKLALYTTRGDFAESG